MYLIWTGALQLSFMVCLGAVDLVSVHVPNSPLVQSLINAALGEKCSYFMYQYPGRLLAIPHEYEPLLNVIVFTLSDSCAVHAAGR